MYGAYRKMVKKGSFFKHNPQIQKYGVQNVVNNSFALTLQFNNIKQKKLKEIYNKGTYTEDNSKNNLWTFGNGCADNQSRMVNDFDKDIQHNYFKNGEHSRRKKQKKRYKDVHNIPSSDSTHMVGSNRDIEDTENIGTSNECVNCRPKKKKRHSNCNTSKLDPGLQNCQSNVAEKKQDTDLFFFDISGNKNNFTEPLHQVPNYFPQINSDSKHSFNKNEYICRNKKKKKPFNRLLNEPATAMSNGNFNNTTNFIYKRKNKKKIAGKEETLPESVRNNPLHCGVSSSKKNLENDCLETRNNVKLKKRKKKKKKRDMSSKNLNLKNSAQNNKSNSIQPITNIEPNIQKKKKKFLEEGPGEFSRSRHDVSCMKNNNKGFYNIENYSQPLNVKDKLKKKHKRTFDMVTVLSDREDDSVRAPPKKKKKYGSNHSVSPVSSYIYNCQDNNRENLLQINSTPNGAHKIKKKKKRKSEKQLEMYEISNDVINSPSTSKSFKNQLHSFNSSFESHTSSFKNGVLDEVRNNDNTTKIGNSVNNNCTYSKLLPDQDNRIKTKKKIPKHIDILESLDNDRDISAFNDLNVNKKKKRKSRRKLQHFKAENDISACADSKYLITENLNSSNTHVVSEDSGNSENESKAKKFKDDNKIWVGSEIMRDSKVDINQHSTKLSVIVFPESNFPKAKKKKSLKHHSSVIDIEENENGMLEHLNVKVELKSENYSDPEEISFSSEKSSGVSYGLKKIEKKKQKSIKAEIKLDNDVEKFTTECDSFNPHNKTDSIEFENKCKLENPKIDDEKCISISSEDSVIANNQNIFSSTRNQTEVDNMKLDAVDVNSKVDTSVNDNRTITFNKSQDISRKANKDDYTIRNSPDAIVTENCKSETDTSLTEQITVEVYDHPGYKLRSGSFTDSDVNNDPNITGEINEIDIFPISGIFEDTINYDQSSNDSEIMKSNFKCKTEIPENNVERKVTDCNDQLEDIEEIDIDTKNKKCKMSNFGKYMQSLEEVDNENKEDAIEVEELTEDQLEMEVDRFRNLTIILPFAVPRLHTITTRTTIPTRQQMQEISDLDIPVKRGPFSKVEDDTILKNWKEFCREHDMKVNPAVFVKFPRRTSMETKMDFLRYIGHGLDNRLLNRIYIRFRYLLQRPHLKTGRFTEEEDKNILEFMKNTHSFRPFKDLAELLHRTSLSVEYRYGLLTSKNKNRSDWTLEKVDKFIKTLMKITKCERLKELKHREVTAKEWKKLSKKLENIPVKKLYRAWKVTIYPRLFSKATNLKDVKRKIIKILCEREETDWRTVDWKEIAKHFKGFTSEKIYMMFKHLVYFHIPENKRSNLKECLDFLQNKLLKYHDISSTHKFKKFVVKNGHISYEDSED